MLGLQVYATIACEGISLETIPLLSYVLQLIDLSPFFYLLAVLFLASCSQRCKSIMLHCKTSALKKKNKSHGWILSTYATFDTLPGASNGIHWRQTCRAVRAAVLVCWGVESVPGFLALWSSCLHSCTVRSDRLVAIPIKVVNGAVCREVIGVSGGEMRGHFRQDS